MTADLERAVGRCEANIDMLDRRTSDMNLKLDTVISRLDEQKGERSAAKWIAGAFGGVVATLIGWALGR